MDGRAEVVLAMRSRKGSTVDENDKDVSWPCNWFSDVSVAVIDAGVAPVIYL